MKRNEKVITILGLSVLVCSLFLVTIPVTAIAAEQDNYVLDIYGNANEDDTIDMRDLTYVKLIFFGKKPKTELADAKYDGKINPLDFIQIKLIIVDKEKELTVVDYTDRIVTVKKPIKRLIQSMRPEMLQSLKVEKDIVVGVRTHVQEGDNKILYPEYQDKPIIDIMDPESIINLYPDVVIVSPMGGPPGSWDPTVDACEKAGITVLRFWGGIYGLRIVEEIEKLGYILDKKDEAAEFIDWYEGTVVNPVIEKVKEIPEEDKPKVYYEYARYTITSEYGTHIAKMGGKDIFEGKSGTVDPEAVLTLNPDIILTRRAIGGVGTDDTTEFKEAREELMSRPELLHVKAVKTGNVYVFSGYITAYMGLGGRQFILDMYMAKWFHPELFEDLDPKAIHQEYLTRFQGLDLDLDEKGVFVYHPEEHPDGR